MFSCPLIVSQIVIMILLLNTSQEMHCIAWVYAVINVSNKIDHGQGLAVNIFNSYLWALGNDIHHCEVKTQTLC